MHPRDALETIGSSRVIWIDDHFAKHTALQLAELLSNHLEITRKCKFDGFEEFLNRIDEEEPDALVDFIEHLGNLTIERRLKIFNIFDEENSNNREEFPTSDLQNVQIETVCAQLKIADEDRWSFEGVVGKIGTLCTQDDSHLSYIIDLNDAYGEPSNKRGLEIIELLHQHKSKATTFLLTHEASRQTEAQKESELRSAMENGQQDLNESPPICVIAKERLEGEPVESSVSDGLRMAIKRAGLRRNIHHVLLRAGQEVQSAFTNAMNSLLEIPPEHLDEYVVGRAHAEGVSELHVIERALTVKMSESMRKLFATDQQALQGAARLRALHSVPLTPRPEVPHKKLEEFRRMELWETMDLVNNSFSALACGDVFRFAADEGEQDPRMFILLVQPCDVMIRPRGVRDAELGFLVPLKHKPDGKNSESVKQPTLPFLLDSKEWLCDFRSTTSARLAILDLSTLRKDGKVRYDKNQVLPDTLLPGQKKSAETLIRKIDAALTSKQSQTGNQSSHLLDSRCTLTLCSTGVFKNIANALYVGVPSKVKSGVKQKIKNNASGTQLHDSAGQTNSIRSQSAAITVHSATISVKSGTVTDQSTAMTYQAAEVMDQPAAVVDQPAATVIQPAVVADQPASPVNSETTLEYLTWKIQRYGRVRMPYAASLLNSYLSLMGRDAFDLDYLKPIQESCANQCTLGESEDQ